MSTQARTIHEMGRQNEQCIEDCQQCHRVCLETMTHYLEADSIQTQTDRVRLLLDCAEVCQTAANFMIRNSALHLSICSSCADICLRCAEACEQYGDDERMKACADACRRCAESCQLMVANATAMGKE
jgi:hypothetical protein